MGCPLYVSYDHFRDIKDQMCHFIFIHTLDDGKAPQYEFILHSVVNEYLQYSTNKASQKLCCFAHIFIFQEVSILWQI